MKPFYPLRRDPRWRLVSQLCIAGLFLALFLSWLAFTLFRGSISHPEQWLHLDQARKVCFYTQFIVLFFGLGFLWLQRKVYFLNSSTDTWLVDSHHQAERAPPGFYYGKIAHQLITILPEMELSHLTLSSEREPHYFQLVFRFQGTITSDTVSAFAKWWCGLKALQNDKARTEAYLQAAAKNPDGALPFRLNQRFVWQAIAPYTLG